MTCSRLGSAELHFWLTRSVARVMGINLSEAMASERLSAQDYAGMVTACWECPRVAACQQWLATQRNLTSSAPPGCANRRLLESLARPN